MVNFPAKISEPAQYVRRGNPVAPLPVGLQLEFRAQQKRAEFVARAAGFAHGRAQCVAFRGEGVNMVRHG